ncbi:MAG: hypothetical protein NC828_00810, partial [Candidatus Omnitrophica bacterium]|nr:hypothetical protein [Candidatus Omnitrophota bacterium]
NFIIGHPWDTIKTIRETMEFAEELKRKYNASYNLFLLIPLPGTELWNNAAKYGLKITKNWDKFCKYSSWGNPYGLTATFDTKYLSREKLTDIYHFLAGSRIFLVKKDFKMAKRTARQLIGGGYLTLEFLAIAISPYALLRFLYKIYRIIKKIFSEVKLVAKKNYW